jgi:hypothetical protein
MATQLAELRGKFSVLDRLNKPAGEEAADKTAAIDPAEDIFGAVNQLRETIAQRDKREADEKVAREASDKAASENQAFVNNYRADADKFKATAPDYMDAYNYLLNARAALSNKLWAKKLNVEALKQTYFGKFMGEGSDNMIQVKMEHSQSAGDSVTIGLRVQLAGDGVTEKQTLMGNEEQLSTYSDALLINELGHAVRVKNKQSIDAQRVPFNLRDEAKSGLKDWFANRLDTCLANHLAGNTLVTDPRYTGNNAIDRGDPYLSPGRRDRRRDH